jgi:hypothetical protein
MEQIQYCSLMSLTHRRHSNERGAEPVNNQLLRQWRRRRPRSPTPSHAKPTEFDDIFCSDSVDEIYGNCRLHSYDNNWWLRWLEDITVVRQLTERVSERRVHAASSVKGHLSDTSTSTDVELEPSSHASDLHGM